MSRFFFFPHGRERTDAKAALHRKEGIGWAMEEMSELRLMVVRKG